MTFISRKPKPIFRPGGIKIIKVLSETKSIRRVSSKILNSLSGHRLDRDKLFDVKLCVEEAVRNAIVHGNRSNKKLYVRVRYRIDKDKIGIEIEDEGKGFDHERIPYPTHKDNIMKLSGRGVYLMRHLMDEIKFNAKGNQVRFVKYLK